MNESRRVGNMIKEGAEVQVDAMWIAESGTDPNNTRYVKPGMIFFVLAVFVKDGTWILGEFKEDSGGSGVVAGHHYVVEESVLVKAYKDYLIKKLERRTFSRICDELENRYKLSTDE
jgi:hypothetical protein